MFVTTPNKAAKVTKKKAITPGQTQKTTNFIHNFSPGVVMAQANSALTLILGRPQDLPKVELSFEKHGEHAALSVEKTQHNALASEPV